MGEHALPDASELLITADGGGSNGNRCRLWKVALQELADATRADDQCATSRRAPASGTRSSTGCSAHITQNWRGRPLVSHEVIVNLIANTTTKRRIEDPRRTGRGTYPTGIKVTDEELATLNLKRPEFHGDWNYTVLPARARS